MNHREATAADIPVIQAIAHAAWPVAYTGIISPAQIAYMLDRMYGTPALQEQFGPKRHRFLIAEQDGAPVGFAGFEHRYAPGRSRLHKLYVLPAMKGTGVGHALLEAVLSEALKAGDTAVELNVNKQNPAKDFYTRHGFTIERDEVLDIGGGFVMDDHVMVRRSGP
ncbi:MAG: GNAT family N-acetyltransferase [Flavobacteriales bacterium]|nr:GNAT family N-acetyltransferase [Flavobacteriales bacterium]